ncbi:hypothetical protein HOLleu_34607 [Holothuria leucospilota]|uniref:Retrotransposon gag domain-containing protein n=1 Tax=Holothuria leucospilota TaxID=206669 RepID=A0A9Q1BGD0_HOLLE|nr:hypothetical protein HOLleu_34607 [Holothuria leucospilota]
MENLRAPEKLVVSGNVAEQWKFWRQKFEIYKVASGLSTKDPVIQCSTLLHAIGDAGLEVYNTFTFQTEDQKKDLNVLLKKFEEHFSPKQNVTFERHVFNTTNQQSGETFEQFLTQLKTRAKTCEFGALTDELVKDRIVVGIREDSVRALLLSKKDLNLEKLWKSVKLLREVRPRCLT